MRIRVKVLVLGAVLACLGAVSVCAQQKPDANDASLAEIARKLKAQKAKDAKPVRVITNDNIPSAKDGEPGFGATPPEKNSAEAPAAAPGTPTPARDEKYYRGRLSTLQGNLDTHKRELEVLQQKLGQNQMQYYPDPNKALQQEYSRGDINKLNADIDAKKQQIADDEKAIEDLHAQLRSENGDPGWLR